MKTTKKQAPGIAFAAEILARAVRTGKPPVLKSISPMQVEPADQIQPADLTKAKARADVLKMAGLLRRFITARTESDTAADKAAASKSTRQTLADAILRGEDLPQSADPSEAARLLAVTRATWQACNTLTPAACNAAHALESARQARLQAELARLEAAVRDSLPPGLDPRTIERACLLHPTTTACREAVSRKFSNILPIKLHSEMEPSPDKRGKLVATGKPLKVLHPLRTDPIPKSIPEMALGDSWSALFVAAELEELVSAFDDATFDQPAE